MIRNKHILLISPEPWSHIFVSKHHYALSLSRAGNFVYFLNPPAQEMGISGTEFPDLYVVSYRKFVKGLRFFPGWFQRLAMRIKFTQIQSMCNVKFDVVWSFDNSVFFDFSFLPTNVLKICHVVDLNQNFQIKKAASTASFCFCTTERIRQRVLQFNARVTKINHGCNLPPETDANSWSSSERPTALYAGNMRMPFIDWMVLKELVSAHPEVDFLFLGPDDGVSRASALMEAAKEAVLGSPNVRTIGKVGHESLQYYYRQADLLLIAYQEEFHQDQANPHKMMEYLGSGRMVVCTFTEEFVDVSEAGLILMSRRNADFLRFFDLALKNFQFWNSDALRMARQRFALENTYEMQIARIEKIICQEREC